MTYMYCKDSNINFTYPARHEESRVVLQVSLYTTGEPQGVPDAGRGCCAAGPCRWPLFLASLESAAVVARGALTPGPRRRVFTESWLGGFACVRVRP